MSVRHLQRRLNNIQPAVGQRLVLPAWAVLKSTNKQDGRQIIRELCFITITITERQFSARVFKARVWERTVIPAKTQRLYNVCTTLVQHCTIAIKMFRGF